MPDIFEIAIVGSGPAGLSAAMRAAITRVPHVLLEKTDHLADTIFRYQLGKLIMATPVTLPMREDHLGFREGSRETILGTWEKQAQKCGLNVRYNAEVNGIAGTKGDFVLTLATGETVHAANVVIAVGTQGHPNLLRCKVAGAPKVQYQLDDPGAYVDEHIFVIGAGDAAIENALGLAADPAQANKVYLVNRNADFARAKPPNVKLLMEAQDAGRITVLKESKPALVEPGFITLEMPEGESRLRCDRIIARLGSLPPRDFVERLGIQFTSDSKDAFPKLSRTFETTVPGFYVVGALAGYPLIKHCINQGYDVVEYICGNAPEPIDQPLLKARLKGLPGSRDVDDWIAFLRENVEILRGVSPLQMREFLLDCSVRAFKRGDVIFKRNAVGSSLFAIASGSILVETDTTDRSKTVTIDAGSIFGEVGLISGRRRGATVRAGADCIVMEIPRNAALKLMASIAEARDAVNRITTERLLLQIFGSGLTADDIADVIGTAKVLEIKPGQAVIGEGEESYDIYMIRRGSMTVEKKIGDKPIFLNYLPAGSYFGEMSLIDGGRRTATVRANIRSEVVRLGGEAFRLLLQGRPSLRKKLETEMGARRKLNSFIEERKNSFAGAVDLYSQAAQFLMKEGIGEATDALLIDETLCIGCDNCERACAEIHNGLSRLDREAGHTFAHLHVPTSCRHCEHPYCMTDCPPNAIHRGPDGEVSIDETCIGCGNCMRYCPYGVIRMDSLPPKKPGLLTWLLFGAGPGPGEPDQRWRKKQDTAGSHAKIAVKCDMCAGQEGGPACVRACPTGAAIRVSPEEYLQASLAK
ncbi:MAG TPA: cyclic nucleotide-binding domain-containing protein [Rhizomicrobium sp.]|nr:cyclic nucleotide-binding domain-containing protein [Rhizomicrobium sp.]